MESQVLVIPDISILSFIWLRRFRKRLFLFHKTRQDIEIKYEGMHLLLNLTIFMRKLIQDLIQQIYVDKLKLIDSCYTIPEQN